MKQVIREWVDQSALGNAVRHECWWDGGRVHHKIHDVGRDIVCHVHAPASSLAFAESWLERHEGIRKETVALMKSRGVG